MSCFHIGTLGSLSLELGAEDTVEDVDTLSRPRRVASESVATTADMVTAQALTARSCVECVMIVEGHTPHPPGVCKLCAVTVATARVSVALEAASTEAVRTIAMEARRASVSVMLMPETVSWEGAFSVDWNRTAKAF